MINFRDDPLFPSEEYTVKLTRLTSESTIPSTNWFNRIVAYPFEIFKKIYNTYLLIRHAELRLPASQNINPKQWMSSFSCLFFSWKMTVISSVMKGILIYPRNDPEGLFHDKENAEVFLPLLKDMFPAEKLDENDFLLTCHKDWVHSFRQPILQFIGAKNIQKHGDEIQKIVEETLLFWKKKASESPDGKINVTELCLVFTTAIISRLLLGHPGPFEAYREISSALDFLNRYIMKVNWHLTISKEEKQKYEKSLEVVRQAIEISIHSTDKPRLGSLVDQLKETEMGELKIKTTLFLMYLGGSETTASVLNYLLWQLGKHPEYQELIAQEMKGKEGPMHEWVKDLKSLDMLFAESIRMFTPAYIVNRRAGCDLVCTIKNKKKEIVFCEKIAKGEGLLAAPTFAGRNPFQYDKPDEFNPLRFKNITHKTSGSHSLPWLPFGDGKHACPGQWLAKDEVIMFVALLIQQFQISSFPDKEIGQKGFMTLKPAEDVWLTLRMH